MRLTQFTLASSFMLFTGSIVLPGTGSVNPPAMNLLAPVVQITDGAPLPPPHAADVTLMVDGAPLPPPHFDGNLMADGAPLPPPHAVGERDCLC